MDTGFGKLLFLEIVLVIFLSFLARSECGISTNRCDTTTRETFRTNCMNCWQNRKVSCPRGSKKQTRGAGSRGCRYEVRVGPSTRSAKGCSHTCGHTVTTARCCAGYWGQDCLGCPKDYSSLICSGKGTCSDGIDGNGTCQCQGNLVGAFCEKCSQPQFYGPTCQSTCACVHGTCDSGINGTGSCFCESGFGGQFCEKALVICSTLNCHPNSSCLNRTGEIRCYCNRGYSGDGMTCAEINPCIAGPAVPCHSQAMCIHTGPDLSSCQCNDGYSGDGYWCAAVDPCQTNSGGCPSNSTTCHYDGPGQSHCECLSGFQNFMPGLGCALKDICGLYPDTTCDSLATCQTIVRYGSITVNCTCPLGFMENERVCYSDLLTEMEKLNRTGDYQNQLNMALAFFKVTYKEILFTPREWTLLVPLDSGFPFSSFNNISSDPLWKARARAHIVAGRIPIDFSVDSAKTMFPLLGSDYPIKALRPSPADDDADDESSGSFATVKFAGKSRVKILVDGKYASNGLIYIIDSLLEVPDQQYFVSDLDVIGTMQKTPNLGGFMDLISKSFTFRRKLMDLPSYALLAPTSDAFLALGAEEYKYLNSPMGLSSLDILLQYHQFTEPKSMPALSGVSRIRTIDAITVNVTNDGIVTLGSEQAKILMSEISVEGGQIVIHLIDKILFPDILKPLVTNRCNSTKSVQSRGPCGHCARTICPTGGVPEPSSSQQILTCVYTAEEESGDGTMRPFTRLGCSRMCRVNVTTSKCCPGFYGSECRSCPGPTHQPCNDHGACLDGEAETGLCMCGEAFTGPACSKCKNQTKYGPLCDQDCVCMNGTCKNTIDSHGECKPGTCADGWSGENCDRQIKACKSGLVTCHQFASCVTSWNGTESCVCDAGYTGSGEYCYAYNPCQGPNWGGCDVNAYCLHLGAGKTACECPPNYSGDGTKCVAIDPCASSWHGNCSKNAICVFTGPGQSRCECKTGYRGDGRICTEINVCQENNGGCHPRARCTKSGPGTATCTCFHGYDGDGMTCTGNVLQEISLRPDLSRLNDWISRWPIMRLVFLGFLHSGFTCFLPDDSAWESLSGDDAHFWITEERFQYLMQGHMVPRKLESSSLKGEAGNTLETKLQSVRITVNKVMVDTSDTNIQDGQAEVSTLPTLGKDYAKLLVPDLPVSQDGVVHIIDSVLVPPRDAVKEYPALSVLTKNLTGTQLAPYKKFLGLIVSSGIIDQIEETHVGSSYTLFVAPDTSTNFPPANATVSEIAKTLRYHIISGQMIRKDDVQHGKQYSTMLGTGYQLSILPKYGKTFIINGQTVAVPDIRTSKGIIHGLSDKLLMPVKTRCDRNLTNNIETICLPCSYPSTCPVGSMLVAKERCVFSHLTKGEIKMTIGCRLECAKAVLSSKCCPGFYSGGCEPCPGGIGNVCYGRGTCDDGIKATGKCTCSDPKYGGLACETCSKGRFGKTCDLLCDCVNGTCDDGVDGKGTCFCDKGFRGKSCDTPVGASDTCNGACHSAADCIPSPSGTGGTCRCPAGYSGNGTDCKAVNPCDSPLVNCATKATCQYLGPGKHKCKCADNYEGDGTVCYEINPCATNFMQKCHGMAYCLHTGPNKAICVCNDNYEGNGFNCTGIDPCKSNNGGCSIDATCKKTGAGERMCQCKEDYVGDGINCTGSISSYVRSQSGYEWFSLMDSVMSQVPRAFSSIGPLFVFLPPHETITKISSNIRASKEHATQLYLNHIVGCAFAGSLANTTKLRTFAGNVLNVTKTDAGYMLNKDITVQGDPIKFWNGMIYFIDKPLIPDSIKPFNTPPTTRLTAAQVLMRLLNPYRIDRNDTTSIADQNSKMLLGRGFSWVASVFRHAGDLPLLQEEIHQKWTLFLPTDDAFNSMPAQKLRLLVNDPSYASEYIRYHMVRESFLTPNDIAPNEILKTMQGSDITLRCRLPSPIVGDIVINNRMSTVTGFRVFPLRTTNGIKPAAVYILDKVLDPPSVGGRCDEVKNVTLNTDCRLCFGSQQNCPDGTKPVGRSECKASGFPSMTVSITGCQLKCAAYNVTHKCCKNYYGYDCHPCPGGALKPCSGNGECSDGLRGNGICQCKDGFAGYACERCTPARYGRNCLPCKCTVHGTCNEGMNGDGVCYCDRGWTGPTCEENTNMTLCNPPCNNNGYCVKSGTCFCKPGYRGDGVNVCDFMNMCQINNGGCSPYATCSLGMNKVICKCLPNFVGDGYYCEGYDPCNATKTGCHAQARCVYVGASTSRCECNEGYHGDGIRMCLRTQYTNCATNNGGCSGHADCVDIPAASSNGYPSTQCTCKKGYVGDGYVCNGNVLEVISESLDMREFDKQLRLQSAKIRMKLSSAANITMFVPADMEGVGRFRPLPPFATSRLLVLGHVYYYKDLVSMKAISMRSGDIYPLARNGSGPLYLNGVRIQKYDIVATNGVIHLLDSFLTKELIIMPTGPPIPTTPATTKPQIGRTTKKSILSPTNKPAVSATTKVATVKRSPIDGDGAATTKPGPTKPGEKTNASNPPPSVTPVSKKPTQNAVSKRRRSNGIKIGVSVLIIVLILVAAGVVYWWRNRHNYVFRPFMERQRLTSSSDPVDDDNYGGMINPAYDSTGFNTIDDDVILTEADIDTAEAMDVLEPSGGPSAS